ncbi:MAG: hypothetical protein OXH16_22475 [Gemmatimonadetes bacterium]|nr:hypothetical protein [Gemmatimonadota bacterium]
MKQKNYQALSVVSGQQSEKQARYYLWVAGRGLKADSCFPTKVKMLLFLESGIILDEVN